MVLFSGATHKSLFSRRTSNKHLGGGWVYDDVFQTTLFHRFQQSSPTFKKKFDKALKIVSDWLFRYNTKKTSNHPSLMVVGGGQGVNLRFLKKKITSISIFLSINISYLQLLYTFTITEGRVILYKIFLRSGNILQFNKFYFNKSIILAKENDKYIQTSFLLQYLL